MGGGELEDELVVVGRLRHRLLEQRNRRRGLAQLPQHPREVLAQPRMPRVECHCTLVCAAGTPEVAGLDQGLSEVEMGIDVRRALPQRAPEESDRFIELLALGGRDAERVEVGGIAPVMLQGALRSLDRYFGVGGVERDHGQHVPGAVVFRIRGCDRAECRLRIVEPAGAHRRQASFHQRIEAVGRLHSGPFALRRSSGTERRGVLATRIRVQGRRATGAAARSGQHRQRARTAWSVDHCTSPPATALR